MKKEKEMTIDDVMAANMAKWKPNSNSGKTRFTRGKAKGESWLKRKAEGKVG